MKVLAIEMKQFGRYLHIILILYGGIMMIVIFTIISRQVSMINTRNK